MTNKLDKLADIKTALSEKGAMLVYDERFSIQSYYVQRADGQRVPCTKVADRLTYGAKAFVKFSHRDPLTRYYVVKDDAKFVIWCQAGLWCVATDEQMARREIVDATLETINADIAAKGFALTWCDVEPVAVFADYPDEEPAEVLAWIAQQPGR